MVVNYRMRIEVLIDGMVSVHAKHAVFAALAGVPGVARAEVDLGRAILHISGDAAPVTGQGAGSELEGAIRASVETAGFNLRGIVVLGRELPLL
jgi:hypothetical protein